jgi:hypothetical protein
MHIETLLLVLYFFSSKTFDFIKKTLSFFYYFWNYKVNDPKRDDIFLTFAMDTIGLCVDPSKPEFLPFSNYRTVYIAKDNTITHTQGLTIRKFVVINQN